MLQRIALLAILVVLAQLTDARSRVQRASVERPKRSSDDGNVLAGLLAQYLDKNVDPNDKRTFQVDLPGKVDGAGTTARPSTTTRPRTTARPPPVKPPSECGISSGIGSKIVGGRVSDKGAWPWMAALLRDNDEQFCGGSLITDLHVLTAAHCVANYKAEDIVVRLGEHDFELSNLHRRDYFVEKIFRHDNYTSSTYQNDIAILKLMTKVEISIPEIQPICLPPIQFVAEGQSGFVAGWGTTSFAGASSHILLEVQLPIWALADCKNAHPKDGFITSKQMCAGFKEGKKDSCRGDSGGPLMLQVSANRWTIVGVVSWGQQCALADSPGVYTKVVAYMDWIKDNLLQ